MDELSVKFISGDGISEAGTPCRVAVFYSDAEARERALKLSSRLVCKFMSDVDLVFSWWKFEFLKDGVIAGLAAQSSAQADMVLYSLALAHELPAAVKACNELWLDQRQGKPGLLVALIGKDDTQKRRPIPVHDYLADLARRGGMQFMSRWESQPPEGIDYLDMMLRRANESSPVLDEIFSRSHHATHWGINE
jgi:hypothetical protein